MRARELLWGQWMRTALLAAWTCAACATAPPVEVEGLHGRVHAWTAQEAVEVRDEADQLGAQVADLLGVALQPHVIHVEREETGTMGVRVWRDRAGRVLRRRIEMGAESRDHRKYYLAHELTHWNVAGTVWDRLPHVAEEGLCDFLAIRLDPGAGRSRDAELRERAVQAKPLDAAQLFAITGRTWGRASRGQREEVYMLGYALADRIGLGPLRALCERAEAEGRDEVPMPRLLEAAGLGCPAHELGAALARWGAEQNRPRPLDFRPPAR